MPRMTEPAEAPPVKLLCGMISARKELFDAALGPLTKVFGPVDLVSDVMDFDFTHYYDAEMGSPLYRRFVSFADLVRPDALVEAKLATNRVERDVARSAIGDGPEAAGQACPYGNPRRAQVVQRPVNLDPGYIEPSKLVLASMKNFSHRIYLGRGVFAEITLMWRKTHWEPLPWTFPDFASGRYFPFLTACRERLRQQAHKGDGP